MAFTLRQKIGSGFVALNVLVIICGGTALYQFSLLDQTVEQATSGIGQKLKITQELMQETNLLRYHGARFLNVGAPDDRTATLDHIRSLQDKIQSAGAVLVAEDDRSRLNTIDGLLTGYGKQFQQVTERFENQAIDQMGILKEIEHIEIPLRGFFTRHPDRIEARRPFLFFMTAKLQINSYLHSLNSQDLYEAKRGLELVSKLLRDGSDVWQAAEAVKWKETETLVEALNETLTTSYNEASALGNIVRNTLLPMPSEMLTHVQEIAEGNWHGMQRGTAALSTMTSQVWWVICFAVAAVFSAGWIIPFFVARSSTRPLIRMGEVLRDMAEGEGDLTQRLAIHSRDEIGVLAHWLNIFLDKLHDIIAEVTHTSQDLAAAAQQLSATSQQLSTGAQDHAASLEETAASLEQLTSTVKQNADNAVQANQLGMDSRDAAESGGQVVQATVSAMAEIKAASNHMAEIVTAIDEIAFQTNLLALNAAVEAARAGEQGRGFAVVAAEVRNLAQRSASAAKEISGLIQDSVQKVADGSAQVAQSGQTLGDIVDSVKQVTDLVEDIASASLNFHVLKFS